jgi:hypothetical protein
MLIAICRSKTDQERAGRNICVAGATGRCDETLTHVDIGRLPRPVL